MSQLLTPQTGKAARKDQINRAICPQVLGSENVGGSLVEEQPVLASGSDALIGKSSVLHSLTPSLALWDLTCILNSCRHIVDVSQMVMGLEELVSGAWFTEKKLGVLGGGSMNPLDVGSQTFLVFTQQATGQRGHQLKGGPL